jgi:iron complex outermembrane receptor protein
MSKQPIFYNSGILKTTVSSGINNLLDRKYAASILPNATGFAAPRYYYPGSPINFYGGFRFYFFYKGINQKLVFIVYRLNLF